MISPIRPPAPSYSGEQPGFKTGLAHLAHGAERLGKRISVLLALCGAMGTTGSVALAWWVTHQDFVKQDQLAQINRSLVDIQTLMRIEQATFGTWQTRVTELELDSKEHGERLAELGTAKKKGRVVK